jgi:CDP-glucose 4,6-dehydratase
MSPPFADALAGRSVFLTGHTGFKGSWLAIWLHRLGARVTGYSLAPPTQPSNFEVSRVGGLLSSHFQADLRDADRLQAAMRETNPEVVFHLAAQSLVRRSYAAPGETLAVNVMGTAAVLDAVRHLARPCVVVIVTSDKCYADRQQAEGYREIDPLGGRDPYSASKAAAEIVAAAYRDSFFPPADLARHQVSVATARAGNVIGGGDWAEDRIAVDLVRSLVAGRPVAVRNPRAVRPWQHVLEPLGGYLTLAARMVTSPSPQWCDAWNFGPLPGQELHVAGLVERFLAAWGEGSWIDAGDPRQPFETAVLKLNVEKSISRLGWRPAWTVEEAIARTARWYRRFQAAGADGMLGACLNDIKDYEAVCF